MIKTDPIYSTAFFTNLGSIGMDTIYHHLYNWGTCSIFISVGKLKKGPLYETRSGICQGNQCYGYEDHPGRQGGGRCLLRQFAEACSRNYVEHPRQLLENGQFTKEQIDELKLEGLGISGQSLGPADVMICRGPFNSAAKMCLAQDIQAFVWKRIMSTLFGRGTGCFSGTGPTAPTSKCQASRESSLIHALQGMSLLLYYKETFKMDAAISHAA
ncbi:MAG: hypothetical protein MZU97_26930 [Bacillus subtilis]|nr:hypothetical protein [Bacillus subtilis]